MAPRNNPNTTCPTRGVIALSLGLTHAACCTASDPSSPIAVDAGASCSTRRLALATSRMGKVVTPCAVSDFASVATTRSSVSGASTGGGVGGSSKCTVGDAAMQRIVTFPPPMSRANVTTALLAPLFAIEAVAPAVAVPATPSAATAALKDVTLLINTMLSDARSSGSSALGGQVPSSSSASCPALIVTRPIASSTLYTVNMLRCLAPWLIVDDDAISDDPALSLLLERFLSTELPPAACRVVTRRSLELLSVDARCDLGIHVVEEEPIDDRRGAVPRRSILLRCQGVTFTDAPDAALMAFLALDSVGGVPLAGGGCDRGIGMTSHSWVPPALDLRGTTHGAAAWMTTRVDGALLCWHRVRGESAQASTMMMGGGIASGGCITTLGRLTAALDSARPPVAGRPDDGDAAMAGAKSLLLILRVGGEGHDVWIFEDEGIITAPPRVVPRSRPVRARCDHRVVMETENGSHALEVGEAHLQGAKLLVHVQATQGHGSSLVDHALADSLLMLGRVKSEAPESWQPTPKMLARLLQKCREAKCVVSSTAADASGNSSNKVSIEVPCSGPAGTTDISVDAQIVAEACTGLLQSLDKSLDDALDLLSATADAGGPTTGGVRTSIRAALCYGGGMKLARVQSHLLPKLQQLLVPPPTTAAAATDRTATSRGDDRAGALVCMVPAPGPVMHALGASLLWQLAEPVEPPHP